MVCFDNERIVLGDLMEIDLLLNDFELFQILIFIAYDFIFVGLIGPSVALVLLLAARHIDLLGPVFAHQLIFLVDLVLKIIRLRAILALHSRCPIHLVLDLPEPAPILHDRLLVLHLPDILTLHLLDPRNHARLGLCLLVQLERELLMQVHLPLNVS
jgi:hypothetical protein